MTKLLIYLKHHYPLVWRAIEWTNGIVFRLLYAGEIKNIVVDEIFKNQHNLYHIRLLQHKDLFDLEAFIISEHPERLTYFRPHGFTHADLEKVWGNPAFIMMGVFHGEKIIGYFFLRCFLNKKCFVGRLVHSSYQGRGIGKLMNIIMYNTGWRSGFGVYSTISRKNEWVMRAHSKNPSMKIVKELGDDMIYVQFIKY